MLQFGKEKVESECDGALEKSQRNGEFLFTMFLRAGTNEATAETSGRST